MGGVVLLMAKPGYGMINQAPGFAEAAQGAPVAHTVPRVHGQVFAKALLLFATETLWRDVQAGNGNKGGFRLRPDGGAVV